MCDNCKENCNQEVGLTSELSELKISPPSSSDTDVIMFCEPLTLSTDNLAEDVNIQLDKDEFIRGLKEASYTCGMYTALINCGMSMEDAFSIILNKMNVEHNIESSKISANANIEVSKNVAVIKEKELL